MNFDAKLHKMLEKTNDSAAEKGFAFVTPEHWLITLTCYNSFKKAYADFGGDVSALKKDLVNYVNKYVIKFDDFDNQQVSSMFSEILEYCEQLCISLKTNEITIAHLFSLIMDEDELFGTYYIMKNANIEDKYEFICHVCEEMKVKPIPEIESETQEYDTVEDFLSSIMPQIIPIPIGGEQIPTEGQKKDWKELVECLNDKVEKEDYIPLVGREQEINDTIAVLLRKDKNNPVHIGESGVGKTAITEGLAKRINEGKVPDNLKDYKIYSCNMGSLVAGTCLRGEFEERLKSVLNGISQEKAILYIDEIHTIVGAGGHQNDDAANIMKPYLVDGNIKIIGATTTKEYRKAIEADSALERRFSPITINEPSKEETKEILNGIKKYYEDYHKCLYSDEIIEDIINLSAKHINDRFFPDKAIDILDESGAYVELNNLEDRNVTADIVEEIVAKKCGIPRETVSSDEVARIKNLGYKMKKIVIGQDSAIDKINENIVLSRSGLRDENKPIANLLFVGPTGVGKTFIAQTLADSLGIPLIRKDMSEFTESHSVSKLFGSPAGYVGYDEGGLLINEIRKTPYCVLLLDEIEKAHPDVYNVFLQIMDNAKLTDSFGKQADFRNVILIMTSNAGAEDSNKRGIGFNSTDYNSSAVNKAVNQTFRPEFRNRLDAIIKFNPMSKEMATKIASNQMNSLSVMLKEKNVKLSYDKNVIDHIVDKGYSKEYGARNIKRTIDTDIKIKLGNEILFGILKDGGNAKISYKDNEMVVEKES